MMSRRDGRVRVGGQQRLPLSMTDVPLKDVVEGLQMQLDRLQEQLVAQRAGRLPVGASDAPVVEASGDPPARPPAEGWYVQLAEQVQGLHRDGLSDDVLACVVRLAWCDARRPPGGGVFWAIRKYPEQWVWHRGQCRWRSYLSEVKGRQCLRILAGVPRRKAGRGRGGSKPEVGV